MEKSHKENRIEKLLVDVNKYLNTPESCKCGGRYVYQGLGVYICEGCGDVFKNEYAVVRDFVDEYGTNYSILEIAEMTKVPKRIIDMFIKDGKFITVEKQRVCIICHNPIDSGVYCNRCALRQMQASFDDKKKKNITSGVRNLEMKGEMHYGRGMESHAGDRDKKGMPQEE